MLVRPATHAGSWYSAHASTLTHQLNRLFAHAGDPQQGARILIGPHAGYTYCGERLAETYARWDTLGVRRVVMLGPLHHVYFKNAAWVSRYAYYDTPLGRLPVDTAAAARLCENALFQYMSADADDDEHLFEMHAPFIVHRCRQDGVGVPQIVPIMVLLLSPLLRDDIVAALLPYVEDPHTTVVILLDFCHWGLRFGYTKYLADGTLALLADVRAAPRDVPIHESIRALDRAAMDVAAAGSSAAWDSYIRTTGNTICGQKPVAIVLRLVEEYKRRGGRTAALLVFEWAGYSQSSVVVRASDLSVSYALGYVRLEPTE